MKSLKRTKTGVRRLHGRPERIQDDWSTQTLLGWKTRVQELHEAVGRLGIRKEYENVTGCEKTGLGNLVFKDFTGHQ